MRQYHKDQNITDANFNKGRLNLGQLEKLYPHLCPSPVPISITPFASLQASQWCKLITGASFQDLPQIHNLALAYTLAGVDCIDVAADPGVITAALEGIESALHHNPELIQPFLMVSLNAGEDPHFRKAVFDPQSCPSDCPRPCVGICPAAAITFDLAKYPSPGVIRERCYGCGRCLPVCPLGHIITESQPAQPQILAPYIEAGQIQALELHTRPGEKAAFLELWQQVKEFIPHLSVLAISCPDSEGLQEYLAWIVDLISPLPCALIWQTDGRPMSGDIGDGATRACVKLAEKVLSQHLPGFVQVAGGTNDHTVAKLRASGLLRSPRPGDDPPRSVAGIAYGSYARSLLAEFQVDGLAWSEVPDLLNAAVTVAQSLVHQIKTPAHHG
ncbi:circadian clock protein LdpA [Synechococcus sp. PCC 6312]|uniref:circadian clock protein LdpA n=1 Tax=Synechococcus sp. (strain ATCC 27167 / PCC 6312) TaxID=195253 RepID=UPI00029EC779|nr:LdpA C-terminal domain-containing domain [Synechococcus sp. PCC 6312]AFY59582.1 Fe-S-cluster-containing hydrogenase subunit [Synechococcus sp. PCC 6312]